jgi:HAD superfamily hydrolase (TIGR01509 family)
VCEQDGRGADRHVKCEVVNPSTQEALISRLAAVLFDMDGLLVDTEPLWLQTETEIIARLGGQPWTPQDQHALLGGSLERTVGYLLQRATRPVPPQTVAEWIMDDISSRIRAAGAPLRPGARRLHEAVRSAGIPVGLVTSSQRRFMQAVLDSTGFVFDTTVCAQDVTATKPDPEPYQLAAKLLAADPARCVVLEDSPNGVAAGEAAGCKVVAVPSLLPIPEAPGRLVVSSLGELDPDRLRRLV